MIFAVSKIIRNFAIRNNQRQKIWQATLADEAGKDTDGGPFTKATRLLFIFPRFYDKISP